MGWVIKNAAVVNADSEGAFDIRIDGERVTALEPVGTVSVHPGDTTYDANGKLVIPGGVDPHVHCSAPSGAYMTDDDFRTGSIAAICGGTTTFFDFVLDSRTQATAAVIENRLAEAEGQSVADYGLHYIVTGDLTADQAEVVERHGIRSLKVFLAYPDLMLPDDRLAHVLELAAERNWVALIHAENGGAIAYLSRKLAEEGHKRPRYHAASHPAVFEAEAVHRAAAFAQFYGAHVYLVHLSTRDSLREVSWGRDMGARLTAETCPHYLVWDETRYDTGSDEEAARYMMSPPLRSPSDQEALWNAISGGDINVIGSDHCPYNLHTQKNVLGYRDFRVIPNGVPGIEHRVTLLYHFGVSTRHLTRRRWVDVVSAGPAKAVGVFPRKGAVQVGSDADLVVFDPAKPWTISAASHKMNVDHDIYEGISGLGAVERVWLRGRLVVSAGEYIEQPTFGRFLGAVT